MCVVLSFNVLVIAVKQSSVNDEEGPSSLTNQKTNMFVPKLHQTFTIGLLHNKIDFALKKVNSNRLMVRLCILFWTRSKKA